MTKEFKACPFCGMQSELHWEDTLHPSRTAWREVEWDGELTRLYLWTDDPEWYHGRCYDIHCAAAYGGCGATVTADSKEEVLQKWNRRFNAT